MVVLSFASAPSRRRGHKRGALIRLFDRLSESGQDFLLDVGRWLDRTPSKTPSEVRASADALAASVVVRVRRQSRSKAAVPLPAIPRGR